MIDVECLIVEIEKHKCLWKATSKAFMDRDAKRQSWIEVGINIFENWKTFSNTEQEEKSKLKKAVFKVNASDSCYLIFAIERTAKQPVDTKFRR